MASSHVIAAVLAGGRGTRLGGGKPGVALAGAPLVSYPLRAAESAGLETVVVAKPGTPLPRLDAVVLREPELPVHPLCGVVTALRHAKARAAAAVVVLACDMPFVSGELLAWIAGLEGTAMARAGGRDQPQLSRVPVTALQALESALARELALTRAIASLGPYVFKEEELSRFGEPARLLFGVNDEHDLERARGWLESREHAPRAPRAPSPRASAARP